MRIKRSGFSLVLSLTIMAAMVMMVIVLASFLQVESRLAQSNAGFLRARFNALASARIAIAQLQVMAGPDQRVTMRADMFSPEIASPPPSAVPTGTLANPHKPASVHHQRRYWTGIWATGGVDLSKPRDWNAADPHDTRLFLGWLTSPLGVDGSNPELADANSLNYYLANRTHFDPSTGKVVGGASSEGQTLINLLAGTGANPAQSPLVNPIFVRLVGGSPASGGQVSGSVQWPATATSPFLQEYYGAVDLPSMPMPGPTMASGALGSRGRYAYWIGDEGIKAKVNLPDANAPFPAASVTDWDKGFAGSAAQRSAIESVTPSINVAAAGLLPPTFGANYQTWRTTDIMNAGSWNLLQLPQARTRGELNAWAARQGGGPAAGDTMATATRLLWHEITPLSFSVLSDTLNGGMKTDLSTAFELPYSVFRTLEMYPGQKNPNLNPTIADRRQSLFHGAPNATFNTTGMASDLDYNRPNLVDKLGSASELLLASPRSAEWAPRYLGTISSIGATVDLIKNRNGGETPERLGFAYEVPLASNFFNADRLGANLVSLTAAANERTQLKNDALPWSDIRLLSGGGDPATHPDNWTARIVRGPTWDLYRNFYRMYKREIEAAAANSNALRGQGAPGDANTFIVRGIEPLTYATGNRGLPSRRNGRAAQDTYDSDTDFPNNPAPNNFFSPGGDARSYFHRNNLADGVVGPTFQAERRYKIPFNEGIVNRGSTPDGVTIHPRHRVAAGISSPTNLADSGYDTPPVTTTRTWPTSPILAPTILRFATIYKGVRLNDKLGMTVDPIIVIHNPYDVPLEFEGLAMVSSGASAPARFVFRSPNISFNSTERQYADPLAGRPLGLPGALDPTSGQHDIGDVVIGGGENDNRSISFRIVAGSNGTTGGGGSQVIRLEPGQIRIISTTPSAPELIDNTNRNVSIPGDIGFELSSRAFYKMTPFHNVRSRVGGGARNKLDERVMWTMDFDVCKVFAEYFPSGSNTKITWTNGGQTDIEYLRRLQDLWNNVKNQRRLHDAFPTWDGSLISLETILAGRPLQILVRNSNWINYNGWVVGTEGETVEIAAGPDTRMGTFDDLITYRLDPTRYIAPTRRTGRISMHGNQAWNFYLIGKKSIDGGANLHTHRRWFGSPDEDPLTYIDDNTVDANETLVGGVKRKIRRYAEGSQTANGFNQVDESLLLNFQAMTGGWPMYSNSNNDSAYYTQVDIMWTAALGLTPPTPNFYIKGSTAASGVPMDPEFNTGVGKGLEPTANKADTLHNSRAINLLPGEDGDTAAVFMIDFVRRAADMTSNTTKWYPSSFMSAGFGMNPSNPGTGRDRMQTPNEMRNAPMTPYFISDRAQQAQLFGYDGKAHAPIGWVETQRVLGGTLLDAEIPTTADKRGAFWGPSVSDTTGKSNIILYPIPRRPLLSLSQLGTAAYAEVSTDADLTVGSSFANPGIGDLARIVEWPGPRDLFPSESTLASDVRGPVPELGYVAKAMGTRPVRNRSDVRTDHAFAANYALWDTYYFSGLNLQANSYSHLDGTPRDWPSSGADLPLDATVRTQQATALTAAGVINATSFASLKTALNEGRRPLANKRMTYFSDGKRSFTLNNDPPAAQEVAGFVTSLRLPETEFPHPKYLARTSLYDGGFNVNSTSRAAWRAVLGGLRGQTLPDAATPAAPTVTALTKFARAFGTADSSGNEPWTQYRELSDTQIDELAGRVVEEVRIRGPFMSLGDFINRRLINSETFGLKGALQAAIDKSSINNTAITAAGGTFPAPASTTLNDPNSNLRGDDANSSNGGSWWREYTAYPNIPANKRFPSIRAMSRTNDESRVTAGLGAPGIVTQMDVLNSVGPNLTARSDTFVVRAYGEAQDEAGNVIGKAWVEVVVQRSTEYMAMAVGQRYPEYVEPTRRRLAYRVNTSAGREYDRQVLVETYEVAPDPNPPGSSALDRAALRAEQRLNRILGRRFRATGLRWLAANEI